MPLTVPSSGGSTLLRPNSRARFFALVAFLFALLLSPLLSLSNVVSAQTPTALNCNPAPAAAATPPVTAETTTEPVATPGPDAIKVTIGYVPVSIFAPIFIAKERGYFAEQGLDVPLKPLPGGSDMVALTATGDFDAGIGGVGPAFWN